LSDGFGRLTELTRNFSWITLAQESRALSKRGSGKVPLTSILWQFGIWPVLSGHLQRLASAIRPGFGRLDRSPIGNRSFLKRMRGAGSEGRAWDSSPPRSFRESHANDLGAGFMQFGMEMVAKGSASFGLEARYPFLDRRVIDFSLSLPSDQKLSNGWPRVILRRAMEGILPPQIQWRFGKADLSANFRRRFAVSCRREVELLRQGPIDPIRDYMDLSGIETAYERFSADSNDTLGHAMTIYSAIMLSTWLRQEYEGVSGPSGKQPTVSTHAPAETPDGFPVSPC